MRCTFEPAPPDTVNVLTSSHKEDLSQSELPEGAENGAPGFVESCQHLEFDTRFQNIEAAEWSTICVAIQEGIDGRNGADGAYFRSGERGVN